MKDTIKFTTCAVSRTLLLSHATFHFMSVMSIITPFFPGEKGYDPQFFHYRVERVFIDDHNVPSLEWVTLSATVVFFYLLVLTSCRLQLHHRTSHLVSASVILIRDMLKYTASVKEWMSADPKNIIAIHCKGGKGSAEDLNLFCNHLKIWVEGSNWSTVHF